MNTTEIDINKLTQIQYDRLHNVLAKVCCTHRKNITVESARRQENGDIIYRIKRKGSYYPLSVTLSGSRLVCKAVII